MTLVDFAACTSSARNENRHHSKYKMAKAACDIAPFLVSIAWCIMRVYVCIIDPVSAPPSQMLGLIVHPQRISNARRCCPSLASDDQQKAHVFSELRERIQ